MDKHSISRRRFLQLTALSAAVGVAAACAAPAPGGQTAEGEAGASSAPLVLSYWHGWSVEFEKQAIADGVELFNQAHTDFQVEPFDGKTSDALLAAIAGGNQPDIGTSWTVSEAAQWRASDLILDLDDMARSNEVDDSLFVTNSIGACKFNGNTYFGLPAQMDATAIYYNKGIFEEAGLDPETDLPKTFQEMFQMGIELTKYDDAGNIDILGLAGSWQYLREGVAYNYGGRWWDAATAQPTANDPGNIAAWTDYGKYYQTIGPEKASTFSAQKAENPLGSQFIAGKVAIAFDGDWVINFLEHYAPDLEYGIFVPPPAEGHEDTLYAAPLDQVVYLIPTGVPHPAESWEFIRWMAMSSEVACLIINNMANSSALLEANRDSSCWVSDRFSFFRDLIDQDKLISWPPIAVSSFYAVECGSASDRVRFGEQTAEEALEDLQQKVVAELAKTAA